MAKFPGAESGSPCGVDTHFPCCTHRQNAKLLEGYQPACPREFFKECSASIAPGPSSLLVLTSCEVFQVQGACTEASNRAGFGSRLRLLKNSREKSVERARSVRCAV